MDTNTYETTQMIAVGSFQTASTGSTLAHSTRWLGDPTNDAAIAEYESWKRKPKLAHWHWKDLRNRRKNLWGCSDAETTDDFHDRMMHQAQLLPKQEKRREYDLTFCISEERDVELQTTFETHAADLESNRNEYIVDLNAYEKKKQKRPLKFSTERFPDGPVATVDWAAKPTKAFLAFWNEILAENGCEPEEVRSLKYRKSRAIPRYKDELVSDLDKEEEPDEDAEELPEEDAVPDEDTVVSDVEEVEPEDDDVDGDNEDPESFSEPESGTSEGTSYGNDPRFSDDEDTAGPPEGHDHNIPIYEDATRKTHDPYTHEELEAARKHASSEKWKKRAPVVLEMIVHGRTPEEALEICGVKAKPKTAQKWKERFMEEAEMLKDRPSGEPNAEMTDEMFDDIKDGAAYVLVDFENGWMYHKLDTETYDDLDAAVQAFKEDKIRAAWKESDVRKNTQKDFIEHKEARRLELQRIRETFDERFKTHQVARDPNQWPKSRNHRGLIGALVSWEDGE